jgi:hypothetical protein
MKILKSYWPHIAGALALLLSYIQPELLQYVGFQKLNSPHATLWGIVAAVLVAYHVTPPGAVTQLPGKWQGSGPKIMIAFFLLLFWPVALSAQNLPSGYPFAVSGTYSSSSGNATNNGMQNTIELSLTNHAPRGWAARLDMFGLNNPSGATLQLASGQYKVQASRLFKSGAPIWTAIDLGFHAGFGALKSSAGAMAFAAGTGASADYNVTPFFFVRVLDLTYAYSRGLGNGGVILGNYESAAVGIGFKF